MVPMNHLTRKDTPFEWSPKCQKAFKDLKLAFTTAPVHTHFDPANPIVIETDGFNYVITTILLQITPSNNDLHPVTFHSCTMVITELNYEIYDKELLPYTKHSSTGNQTWKVQPM